MSNPHGTTLAARKLIAVAVEAPLGELSAALDVASDASKERGNRGDVFEVVMMREWCVVQFVGKLGELDPFPGSMRLAEAARLIAYYPADNLA